MSHPEDRWASLAEELGLPTEGGPVAKKQSSPPPPPMPPPTPAPAAVFAEPITAPVVPLHEERVEVTPAAEGAVAAPPENGGEGSAEGDKARGRKRRRRRGRKPAGAEGQAAVEGQAEAEGAEIETGPEEAVVASAEIAVEPGVEEGKPSEEQGEDRTRRRRRRRRKGEPVAVGEEAAVQAEEPEIALQKEPATEPAFVDEDDEAADDLTDLNLPSWNELIAGLYRPPDR